MGSGSGNGTGAFRLLPLHWWKMARSLVILLLGRGLHLGFLQMALIDPVDLAILAAISFGFGVLLGIFLGYGIRHRRYRILLRYRR
jgi:hypothetical protein